MLVRFCAASCVLRADPAEGSVSRALALPAGVQVFERGWLSSNNVLLRGDGFTTVVDSGYCTHAPQTLELLATALDGQPLNLLVNTHLHSDHCGGNAALQTRYPDLQTFIPPGHAAEVANWDRTALTYEPTGQQCPRFRFDKLLQPGSTLLLGANAWEIHAAKGHDPHSVVLFEPESRTLISADALWENGFGVVFPELEGSDAFAEVGATLDMIETLAPAIVIPGHGRVFYYSGEILDRSRRRLQALAADPVKHARHAAKVLLKFKLLEMQQLSFVSLLEWTTTSTYFAMIRERFFPALELQRWVEQLCDELVVTGAARREGQIIANT
jgi:glyoxylase-like metal-dependent hydrolase (beta-lactamase superfamily II)